jgi:hypothetical protein
MTTAASITSEIAARIAAKIAANAAAYHDGRIDFAQFDAQQRAAWDAADAFGVQEQVLDIIAGRA